jgi:hydrogenase maturation protein HypF
VVEACRRLRERTGLAVGALSGGVFQNALLLERGRDGLEAAGSPCSRTSRCRRTTAGLSYGQAVVAAARDRHAPS